MASIAFDTRAFVKELTAAGLPEAQAWRGCPQTNETFSKPPDFSQTLKRPTGSSLVRFVPETGLQT